MTTFTVTIGNQDHIVEVDANGHAVVDGVPMDVDIRNPRPNTYIVSDGDTSTRIVCAGGTVVLLGGQEYDVVVQSERDLLLRKYSRTGDAGESRSEIRAPMPALVVGVEVAVGDSVAEGQGVIILEAMKMENELKAHRAGTVKEILVTKGETVEKNDLLLILE